MQRWYIVVAGKEALRNEGADLFEQFKLMLICNKFATDPKLCRHILNGLLCVTKGIQ